MWVLGAADSRDQREEKSMHVQNVARRTDISRCA